MGRGSRVDLVKLTLDRVKAIATSVGRFDQSGINIRFLNYANDASGDFDNMTDPTSISQRVGNVYQTLRGGSQLGGRLYSKIIIPFIYERVKGGRFDKPLVVVLITDGQVRSHI